MIPDHNSHNWEKLSTLNKLTFKCSDCGLIYEKLKDPFYHFRLKIYGLHNIPSCEEIRMRDALE